MSRRSTRSLVPLSLAAATILVFAAAARPAAQSPPPGDPRVLGTWNLDVAKSRFAPGPPPTSQVRTYEPHDNGYKATIKTTYASRKPAFVEYVANYDSLEYPVAGSPDYDSIRLKKIDASTSEAVLGHAGKVFATTRRVISDDGQTMTITVHADEVQGNRIHNVMVFTRQK
jgi:hypothetical protein